MPHRADTDDEVLEALLPLCGEVREPAPTTGAGSGAHGDPKFVAPEEVVQRLDEMFAQDLVRDARENVESVRRRALRSDDRLLAPAKDHSEARYTVSPGRGGVRAPGGLPRRGRPRGDGDRPLGDGDIQAEAVKLLARALSRGRAGVRFVVHTTGSAPTPAESGRVTAAPPPPSRRHRSS